MIRPPVENGGGGFSLPCRYCRQRRNREKRESLATYSFFIQASRDTPWLPWPRTSGFGSLSRRQSGTACRHDGRPASVSRPAGATGNQRFSLVSFALALEIRVQRNCFKKDVVLLAVDFLAVDDCVRMMVFDPRVPTRDGRRFLAARSGHWEGNRDVMATADMPAFGRHFEISFRSFVHYSCPSFCH